MEGIMELLRNERGVVLVISLLILALLVGAGVGALVSTQTDLKTSGNLKTAAQAFYIAEAGLQRALRNLNKISNWIGSLSDPTTNAFPSDNSLGGGTYVVRVFENDPSFPNVRIRSIGSIASSSSTVEAVATPQVFGILNYATFNCGNLTLKEGVNNLIRDGDVFVQGNVDLKSTGTNQIQNGDVFATGNININGTSSITGGNAFANGNIDVQSSAVPNIGGNATAGGNISGGGTVSGTQNQNASPAPVTDLCLGTELAKLAITSDVIQGFRDNADTTINNFTVTNGSSITFTGIVHITGNFELTGNATFSENVIFIVDGNAEIIGPGSLTSSPSGSSVTFLVPTGNWKVKGGGNFTMDGILHVGTVNPDGSGISGGNVDVKEGSSVTVNGSVFARGNTDSLAGGAFTVINRPPTDGNLTKPGSFTITRWNDVIG